jgi:phosphoserine phosphatase
MGKTLTIFDLDNTLIRATAVALEPLYGARRLGKRSRLPGVEARLMDDYDRGEMNIADYVALIRRRRDWRRKAGRGRAAGALRAREIMPRVPGVDLIRTLQAKGEQMLVISASIAAGAGGGEYIEQALGIDVEIRRRIAA